MPKQKEQESRTCTRLRAQLSPFTMAVTKPTGASSPVTIKSPNRTPRGATMPLNVANVVIGNLHVKPWYPSFYPEEMIGGRKTEWLYVCQWCFKYTHEIMKYSAHCKVCSLKDEAPPGEVIYEKDGYAIHQLDGEDHKVR